MLTKKCILFNTDEQNPTFVAWLSLTNRHVWIKIARHLFTRSLLVVSNLLFLKSETFDIKRKYTRMWFVFSNQGTAIPTASTFGEKKTANREIPNLPPYPSWPRSWTNSWIPVCLRQLHQNTYAHSRPLGTDIPVQQHKLVLYFAFFFYTRLRIKNNILPFGHQSRS